MSNRPGSAMTAQEATSHSQRNALDRPARTHGPLRKALRNTLHYLSYHFVLSRPKTQESRAAGFRLTVPPTVFHPGYFISSEAFAKFVDGLNLSGLTVVDVGTGTGIIALAAARAGAKNGNRDGHQSECRCCCGRECQGERPWRQGSGTVLQSACSDSAGADLRCDHVEPAEARRASQRIWPMRGGMRAPETGTS